MQEQVNDILNIVDCREQFYTRVFIQSNYYNVSLSRLHIKDMVLDDDWLNVTMDDGRLLKFRILEDTIIYSKNIKSRNIAKDINSWNIYDGENR